MVETCQIEMRPLGVGTPSRISASAICRADIPFAMLVMIQRTVGAVIGSGSMRSFASVSQR
jgi:hypothetical protein